MHIVRWQFRHTHHETLHCTLQNIEQLVTVLVSQLLVDPHINVGKILQSTHAAHNYTDYNNKGVRTMCVDVVVVVVEVANSSMQLRLCVCVSRKSLKFNIESITCATTAHLAAGLAEKCNINRKFR